MMMIMMMMTITATAVAETVASVASLTASSSKGSSNGSIVVSSKKVESNLIPNNYIGGDQKKYEATVCVIMESKRYDLSSLIR